MVSLQFDGEDVVGSTFFERAMTRSRQVEKLTLSTTSLNASQAEKLLQIVKASEKVLERVKTLTFTHVNFEKAEGSGDMAAFKFANALSQFKSVESLTFNSIGDFATLIKYLTKTRAIQFESTLTSLVINACHIPDPETTGTFSGICELILRFPNLTELNLKGMRVGEHIADLAPAAKHAKTKSLNLELNGIEPEYVLYLRYLINFQTLECLDLTGNWIGLGGLTTIKDDFTLFKRLKVLKLGGTKLFKDEPHLTEDLRDMLLAIRNQLTELYIPSNTMRDEDLTILA